MSQEYDAPETPKQGMSRGRKLAIGVGGAIVAVVILAVGGTWVYINWIKDDAPAELSFEERDAATDASATVATGAATTAAAAADTTAGAGAGAATPSDDSLDGTWTATADSELGYRVKEVLFGQSTEGVGRTNAVTGTLNLAGTNVDAAEFTVDMTTVTSDSGNRDNQFSGRIMDTATFPTASFTLTQPIELAAVPAEGEVVTASATGDLTLRGNTQSVTFDVQARLNAGNIEVDGSIPIVFADWDIPNPSFGPASTEDNGLLEFLLVFAKS